jgi:hypothetical protein
VFFTQVAYASEAAAQGAEAAAEGGGLQQMLGSVYPHPATIWPTILAFLVLFFLLYRFAFPIIIKMLDERADKIRESREGRADQTTLSALEDYEQMAEAWATRPTSSRPQSRRDHEGRDCEGQRRGDSIVAGMEAWKPREGRHRELRRGREPPWRRRQLIGEAVRQDTRSSSNSTSQRWAG